MFSEEGGRMSVLGDWVIRIPAGSKSASGRRYASVRVLVPVGVVVNNAPVGSYPGGRDTGDRAKDGNELEGARRRKVNPSLRYCR